MVKLAKDSFAIAKRTGNIGEALVGFTAKGGQYAFKVATHEVLSAVYESYQYVKHRDHEVRGIEYDSNCSVCTDWL